ncbi:AAA family ATPase [Photobacterium phosphoreum]|uniref:AAA family ATPase n=1 Tax=Photobacterium phosphoreum TaxID=659 RepID=UPI0039AF01FF
MKKAIRQLDNPHFIKRIEIEGLLGKKNIIWDLDDVNVLVGHNGSGKSTILEIVKTALLGPNYLENSNGFFNKFDNVKVTLNNGIVVEADVANEAKNENNMLSIIRTMLQKRDTLKKSERKELEHVYNLLSEKKSDLGKLSSKKFIAGVNPFLSIDKNGNEKNNIFNFINIESISTFDMILLSKEEQDNNTDGESNYSQLDILINKEIVKLSRLILKTNTKTTEQYSLKTINDKIDILSLSRNNLTSIYSFIEKLNDFFSEEEKTFKLKDDGELIIDSHQRRILPKELSSGEKQLLYIFLKVVNSSDKPTILFLDEPEISMHLKWQQGLIDALRSINSSMQIIAVSHSPALIMKGWMPSMTDIKQITNIRGGF